MFCGVETHFESIVSKNIFSPEKHSNELLLAGRTPTRLLLKTVKTPDVYLQNISQALPSTFELPRFSVCHALA